MRTYDSLPTPVLLRASGSREPGFRWFSKAMAEERRTLRAGIRSLPGRVWILCAGSFATRWPAQTPDAQPRPLAVTR